MFLSVAHAEVARPQSSSKLLRERGPHGYILLPHVSPGRGGVDMESSSQCCRLHGTFFFDEQRGVGKAGFQLFRGVLQKGSESDPGLL